MIQDQSESNSERGKYKNVYLSEEAGLTPLLATTQSFEDCDWLVVQKGNKIAPLRVQSIISFHFETTGIVANHSCIFPVAKYVNVVITSISGTMAFQRRVSMSLIRSVTNMIPV